MPEQGHISKLLLATAAALFVLSPLCPAQESPWSLTGDVTTGFATNYVVDGGEFRNSVTPFNLNLNLDGYLGHPDFLSFSLRPQLLAGENAPQAGFGGQNGYTASVRLLRRRAFPLTVSYSDYRLDSMAYGALLGLDASRYRTRYEDLSFTWQLRFRRLPRITLSAVHANSQVKPELIVLPTQTSRDNNYGVQFDYARWGWGFQGEWRRTRRALDSFAPQMSTLTSLSTDQDSKWAYFNAQKHFSALNLFSISAGRRDVDELLNHLVPLQHEGYYTNLTTSLAGRSRWSALFQAAYNSDRSGIFQQGPLPVTPGAGIAIFSTGISTFTASSDAHYDVHKNWNLFGGLHWTQARNRNLGEPRFAESILSSNAGLGFHKRFSWANLNSSYALSYAFPTSAPPTVNYSSIGHAFSLQADRGNLEKLELNGVVSAGINRITSDIFLQRRDVLAELGLARRMRNYILRGRFGYRTAEVQDFSTYNYHDWSFQIGAEHRRFGASYHRNMIGGTSVTLGGSSLGNPLLRRFLSTSRTQGLTVNLMPWRNLHAQVNWMTLGQVLDGSLRNQSHYLDSSLGYNFRQMTLDIGYARYDQDLLGLAGVARSSFYVRLKRSFRVF
ncbi:MAG: hypothetical protein LAN84_04405 [Acidobacteriia bacterium]|nr:hypothetical protein [Terriglobia bacterium]